MDDQKVKELKNKIAQLESEIKKTEKKDDKKKESFVPLKVLHTWKAPTRAFEQRDKAWFLKVAIIALFLILLSAFLQDFFIILVVCVVVLVAFLLGSIPPQVVEHRITNKGIYSIDTLYKWDDLAKFWVAQKKDRKIVYVDTKLGFPNRLVLLINTKDENLIIKLLGEKLEYAEFVEKQGWLSRTSDGEMINPAQYTHLFKKEKNQPPQKQQAVQTQK